MTEIACHVRRLGSSSRIELFSARVAVRLLFLSRALYCTSTRVAMRPLISNSSQSEQVCPMHSCTSEAASGMGLTVGMRVVVHGLTRVAHLNGCVGTIQCQLGERWGVAFDVAVDMKAVRAQNLCAEGECSPLRRKDSFVTEIATELMDLTTARLGEGGDEELLRCVSFLSDVDVTEVIFKLHPGARDDKTLRITTSDELGVLWVTDQDSQWRLNGSFHFDGFSALRSLSSSYPYYTFWFALPEGSELPKLLGKLRCLVEKAGMKHNITPAVLNRMPIPQGAIVELANIAMMVSKQACEICGPRFAVERVISRTEFLVSRQEMLECHSFEDFWLPGCGAEAYSEDWRRDVFWRIARSTYCNTIMLYFAAVLEKLQAQGMKVAHQGIQLDYSQMYILNSPIDIRDLIKDCPTLITRGAAAHEDSESHNMKLFKCPLYDTLTNLERLAGMPKEVVEDFGRDISGSLWGNETMKRKAYQMVNSLGLPLEAVVPGHYWFAVRLQQRLVHVDFCGPAFRLYDYIEQVPVHIFQTPAFDGFLSQHIFFRDLQPSLIIPASVAWKVFLVWSAPHEADAFSVAQKHIHMRFFARREGCIPIEGADMKAFLQHCLR